MTHAHRYSKSVKVWNLATRQIDKELPVDGVRELILGEDNKSALILTNDRAVLWQWEENKVETIVQRACQTAVFNGNEVLLVARPVSTSSNAASSESAMAELIVWD